MATFPNLEMRVIRAADGNGLLNVLSLPSIGFAINTHAEQFSCGLDSVSNRALGDILRLLILAAAKCDVSLTDCLERTLKEDARPQPIEIKNDLSSAELGTPLWSDQYGRVLVVRNECPAAMSYPISVATCDQWIVGCSADGIRAGDTYPTIFWDKVEIAPPARPTEMTKGE